MATSLLNAHRRRYALPVLNHVVIWGDVHSGKDTWAASLPSAAADSDLTLRPFDEATAAWQAQTRARMARGDFPRATGARPVASELPLLTFELCQAAPTGWLRRRARLLIQIRQAAGAWWDESHTLQQTHAYAPDSYEFLTYASGIVCLLDPTTANREQSATMLMTMLDYLDVYRRRHKRHQGIRIALWLTKMDHPQHCAQYAHVETYAHTLFGERLASFLAVYAKMGGYEFRWGGCSAVGTVTHQGRVRSNSYWDYSSVDATGAPRPIHRILDPGSLAPQGVLEPLRWVIAPMFQQTDALRTPFGHALQSRT